MKLCRGCTTEKPEEDFYYGMNFCKPCHGKRTNDRARERAGLSQERKVVKINTKLQLPDDGTRLCRKCNTRKPAEDFPINGKDGVRKSKCRDCFNQWQKDFREKNPEKKFAYRLTKVFHWTVDGFKKMLAEQGGCAVCGRPEPEGNGWHIDHDHACCPGEGSCGKCIRGICCMGCNSGLGCFKDDPARLRKGADYLERTSKKPVQDEISLDEILADAPKEEPCQL